MVFSRQNNIGRIIAMIVLNKLWRKTQNWAFGTIYLCVFHDWASLPENLSNNKGPDQPALPHILISAIDIHFLESIISRLATSEISIF